MSDGDRVMRPEHPRARLIVNADDFGRTDSINAAVLQAHTEGILTSCSLMVTGDAADAAARMAREHADLAVGLHVVVLGGRAALPPSAAPHLVDGEGRFSRRPFATGVRYAFSRGARAELPQEMRAQFEAFRATGLSLSHVDGHHHMHLHPTVFRRLLPLAQEYEAHAVRVPIADELLLSLRVDRHHAALKLGWKIVFALLAAWCRRSLRRYSLPTADRVYGLMQTGRMSEAYWLRLVERLAGPPGVKRAPRTSPLFEVFCHPSLRSESDRLGPNPGDLASLMSPAVRAAVEADDILLTTYPAESGRARSGRPEFAHAPGGLHGWERRRPPAQADEAE
jgi:hopanoid biosynthesis associated protein HpnK